MQTNPQTLINTPGAGNAEKALRKAGLWKLTPQEKLQRAMDKLSNALEDAHDYYGEVKKHMRETQ